MFRNRPIRLRMKALALLLISSSLLVGCSKELTDFVNAGGPGHTIDVKSPASTSSPNPYGVKISPGANMASGSALSARFAVTASQNHIEGAQLKANITFSRNRPQ